MMSFKKSINLFVLLAVLLASFAVTGSALAWSGCGASYVVQWGDTLASVAYKCGTTIDAIRQANPNIRYWLYAGQTIAIPGYYPNNQNGYYPNYQQYGYQPQPQPATYNYGYGSRTYVVQWGDTLRTIGARYGVSVSDIQAANPQIWNPNWIFYGQVINLPHAAQYYTVCRGDTLANIAARFGTTLYNLESLNHLWNPNLIYAGQVIRVW
jgi:tyrosinase